MIYIVEIPHQRQPIAWAGDREHIINVAHSMALRGSDYVYEESTPRILLSQYGYSTVEEARSEGDTATAYEIQALIERFGIDATIYRGFGEANDWQTKPVDEFECAINYIGHDLSSLFVFMDEDAAIVALNDGTFACHQGDQAEAALASALARYQS